MNVILVAFKADGARKDFRVRGARCIIGRRPEAELRIPSSTVSRQHAEIVVAGGKALVRDLGSSNGTFLNEVRVQEAALGPGDRLSIGPVVFVVQIDGVPAEIAPITSHTMPTAAMSDPKSATKAPIVSSILDESSMITGAPAMTGDDSGVGAAVPAKPSAPSPAKADEDAEDDNEDPLAKLFSKSKKEDESSVFDFDFDDLDDDQRK